MRRLSQRRARRRDLMNSLANARPARLDPDCPPRVAWPDAHYFTQADTALPAAGEASSRRAVESGRAGEGRERRARRRGGSRTGPRMIPAAAAALTMCVIMVLIVVVRTELRQAHHQRPAPKTSRGAPSVTFHDLRLTGHWRGHVAYGVSEGVLYLAGSVCATTGSGTPIATLPPGARPARRVDVVVALGHAGAAELAISPNGRLSANAGACGPGPRARHVWLYGVSFSLSS